MSTRQIRACELYPDSEPLLERAMQQQGLTAPAHDRILKVARNGLEGQNAWPFLILWRLFSTAFWTAGTGRE